MLIEQDLTPILWVREFVNFANSGIATLSSALLLDPTFRDSLHNKIYLLQKVGGTTLGFQWIWHGGVYSPSLQSTLTETLETVYFQQLSQYLESHSLTDLAKEKVAIAKKIIAPPDEWTGDCESIWLKGESSLLYLSAFEPKEPVETFKERTTTRLAERLPGIPQPLILRAYDRLNSFDAFNKPFSLT